MARITFGTSGWRGILCEDFIFENVKIVTQAIADHLIAAGEKGGVVIGYDSRFMGDSFAKESARVLAAAGLKCYLCKRDTPTPGRSSMKLMRRRQLLNGRSDSDCSSWHGTSRPSGSL